MKLIVELIQNETVGSQYELAQMLRSHGLDVTQATLSRDLKTLKISKVSMEEGGYKYIIPDGRDVVNTLREHGMEMPRHGGPGYISIDFSGNLAIIKTRNGYAPALAYDIDMAQRSEIAGTIAGADTVLVVIREGYSQRQVLQFLKDFAL